ncbi:MAG: sigma-70 family RNA polymerase sigma factor [Bacteroidales bacterium]|nr:sigma-70 family RNA polymerase sigma factor [Bacteroidales bacterium]
MTIESFKIEVLPLKNKLYRLAKRLLENVQEAEDVVQEVFLRLWARRDRLDELQSIEAFAMTIAKNLSLDKLKSKGYRSEDLTERNEQIMNTTPYKSLEINDSYKKVLTIIDSLPEQQRLIIHMRDIEDYDYDEIAGIMKLSVNTIRVNLSRARKKVRETLIKTYDYEFAKN